ncbi:10340_t:CDS:2 [Funneliformis caledonium]|uniref:10340_t:CDS:1 n=1 Tax=Funneliformis caledonium TaxID=1117310 RepID=A0A9N9ECA2_9GLOM|nr:10340_t:CDS:2 [Funneliformis caledonium]
MEDSQHKVPIGVAQSSKLPLSIKFSEDALDKKSVGPQKHYAIV